MKLNREISNKNINKVIIQVFLLFVLIQPILDLLSYISVITAERSLSFFLKPLLIFGLLFYVLILSQWKKKWKYLIFMSLCALYCLFHLGLFKYVIVFQTERVMQEFNFLINIFYGISSFVIVRYLLDTSENISILMDSLIDVLVKTLCLFAGLVLMSILFKISTLSYEHADPYKLGFKGLFNNSSILGHMSVLLLPLAVYVFLYKKSKLHPAFKIFALALISMMLYGMGNKVPFFAAILVFMGVIVFEIYKKIIQKQNFNYLALVCSGLVIVSFLLGYKSSASYHNILINQQVSQSLIGAVSQTVSNSQSGMSKPSTNGEGDAVITGRDIFNYAYWETIYNIDQVAKKYPSLDGGNSRLYQIMYSYFMFDELDWKNNLLGIGFVFQPSGLQPESDFIMAFFNFGILGFICMLGLYIVIFVKYVIYLFKRFKKIEALEFLLIVSLVSFFGISIYAGYTFLYTNYSLYLGIVFALVTGIMQSKSEVK